MYIYIYIYIVELNLNRLLVGGEQRTLCDRTTKTTGHQKKYD